MHHRRERSSQWEVKSRRKVRWVKRIIISVEWENEKRKNTRRKIQFDLSEILDKIKLRKHKKKFNFSFSFLAIFPK